MNSNYLIYHHRQLCFESPFSISLNSQTRHVIPTCPPHPGRAHQPYSPRISPPHPTPLPPRCLWWLLLDLHSSGDAMCSSMSSPASTAPTRSSTSSLASAARTSLLTAARSRGVQRRCAPSMSSYQKNFDMKRMISKVS
jgi:hypothetical protein